VATTSLYGTVFTPLGEPFTTRPGRWIGGKAGLFVSGVPVSNMVRRFRLVPGRV